MNEQIKELMKQAGTDSSGKWMGMNHAEKFAELIVAECIRLCDQVDLAGADDCIDNIKDHFGVKE